MPMPLDRCAAFPVATFTVDGTSATVNMPRVPGQKVMHAIATGAGSITGTINVYGNTIDSTAGAAWLGTLTLNGSLVASDQFPYTANWPYVYGVASGLSGSPTILLNAGF